jgi:hypothetical protein
MELNAVEIPRSEARQSYLDYRREAKRTNDSTTRRELEEISRAFRVAAQEDLDLIALTPTLARAGTVVRTRVELRYDRDAGRNVKSRNHYLLPKLAVANATARFVFTLGVQPDGAVELVDGLGRADTYRKGRLHFDTGFELPEGFGRGSSIGRWTRGAWSAMVPVTPPKHRPSRGFSGCKVLWEADDWAWQTLPAPPGDPALLKHVGGDIYAVLATWDLSPVEQLVLSGRSLDEAIA